MINNETGETKEVTKTGEYIKKFDVNLTGRKKFHERLEYSKEVLNSTISLIKTYVPKA